MTFETEMLESRGLKRFILQLRIQKSFEPEIALIGLAGDIMKKN